MRQRSAFTLIELLVVIAIIAVISIVVLLTINPAELLRESRDSNRIAALSTLKTALGIYSAEGGTNFGTASLLYISTPDPLATSTAGDQCQGLGTVLGSYSLQCASNANFQNDNGTGWIPVNFTTLAGGAPFSQLPVDPVNSSSSNLFYTYVSNGTQYEVSAALESTKYGYKGSNDMVSTDGGILSNTLEEGSNLGLLTVNYGNDSDQTLVGYWRLNEGAGTTVYDSSEYSNNGTIVGSSTWQTNCNGTNTCLQLDGGSLSGYINIPVTTSLNFGFPLTVGLWIKTTCSGYNAVIDRTLGSQDYLIQSTGGNVWMRYDTSGGSNQICNGGSTMNNGSWHFIASTITGTGSTTEYLDGSSVAACNISGNITNVSGTLQIAAPATGCAGYYYGVRLYDRALTASQISSIYNSGQ